MADEMVVRPIGWVRGGRSEPIDDDWGKVEATIELDAGQFTPDALLSLDAFSHLEVIFHFHAAPLSEVNTGARQPRGKADWPLVGIFAQRGKAGRTASASRCAKFWAWTDWRYGYAGSTPSTARPCWT